MLLEPTIEKLVQMKLYGMAESLKSRLSRSDHADLSHADLFGLVVDDEWTHREKKRMEVLLRMAAFKDAACLEDVDYRQERNLKKAAILELGQNAWIEQKQNLVLIGPTGAGKSYLSQALGNKACRDGYSVLYFRMSKFLMRLKTARLEGSYTLFLKRLSKARVVVLDDFGLDLIEEQAIRDFLEMLDDRQGVGSVILTTQLPVSDWHEYLGGGIIADSICDRLLSSSQRIELNSKESMRKPKAGLTKKREEAQTES